MRGIGASEAIERTLTQLFFKSGDIRRRYHAIGVEEKEIAAPGALQARVACYGPVRNRYRSEQANSRTSPTLRPDGCTPALLSRRKERAYSSAHTVFIVFVAEAAQIFASAVGAAQHHVGMMHPVEHRGLYSGVVVHVAQGNDVTALRTALKEIVTFEVPAEA